MKLRSFLTLLALLGLAAIPLSAASLCDAVANNLVANCGFETLNLANWTFTPAASGSDFFISTTPAQANSGSGAAWFGAVGSLDDSISQVLPTTPGTVRLQFYLMHDSTNSANDFNVYWDGSPVYQILNRATFSYTLVDIPNLVATGHDTLMFAGRDVPAFYGLDDVVATEGPEPGTIGMLFGGLGLLVVGRLRRRA
jgi:hypothetical protein